MALTKQDKEEITQLVERVVNGNIKRVENKVDLQLKKLEPVVEAVMWINTTKKIATYVAGAIVTIATTVAAYNTLK